MRGALFSLLSSGLHLMSGEVKSISCWNKQGPSYLKSPPDNTNQIKGNLRKVFTWVVVQDLLLVRIRSGVLVKSMSSFSWGCGAGRSNRRTCRENRDHDRDSKCSPQKSLHGSTWSPGAANTHDVIHRSMNSTFWTLKLDSNCYLVCVYIHVLMRLYAFCPLDGSPTLAVNRIYQQVL